MIEEGEKEEEVNNKTHPRTRSLVCDIQTDREKRSLHI